MNTWYIGIDDTDGASGGCTTHLLSLLIDALADHSTEFLTYPRLIRFNPNIPFKTRGNGGLAIGFRSSMSLFVLKELLLPIIKSNVAGRENADEAVPGFVILQKPHPDSVQFYYRALTEVLSVKEIIERPDIAYYWPEEGSRGLVGAYCAIVANLSYDYTFELIPYRKAKYLGTPRIVDTTRVKMCAEQYTDSTFSSFDFQQQRELIAPAGVDPVFCGIRGRNIHDLHSFLNDLQIAEPLDSWTIFITNQATGAHVHMPHNILLPYHVFSSSVVVTAVPKIHRGGHVLIPSRSDNQLCILIAFEPTKSLAINVQQLLPGDEIFIHGAVVHHQDSNLMAISLEQVRIVDAPDYVEMHPPMCVKCNKRMTSAGKLAGYKCKICGATLKISEQIIHSRNLYTGQVIYAAASAQRHLTRPWNREYRRNRTQPSIPKLHNFRGKF